MDPFTGTLISSYGNFWGEVGALAWSPDGKRIAIGSWDTTVQIWDTRTEKGETIFTHETNPGSVNAVDWSFDGKYLLSASDEGKIVVQETETWKLFCIYSHHNPWVVFDAKWSPDHYHIASCNGPTVQVWDATTEASLVTYSGHTDTVLALAWAQDGKRIASAGFDKTVQVWDVVIGNHIYTHQEYKKLIGALAWSPDGNFIASAGDNGTVQIWQASEG